MRSPDIEGAVAKAWRMDLAGHHHAHVDQTASVALWFITGPFHPFWSWWVLTVLHLRDIPGQSKPATKLHPAMTHELTILSIHPDYPPDLDTIGPIHWLLPHDVIEQFTVGSDRDAVRIAEAAVRAICAGQLSPDQDYRSAWKRAVAEFSP